MKIKLFKFLDKLLAFVIFFFRKRKAIEFINIKKIGVIKLSAMGDAICLEPAIFNLKKAFPDSKITWITSHRTNSFIFKNSTTFDSIDVIGLTPFYLLKLLVTALHNNKNYDLIIDFDQYYLLSELISRDSKVSIGFDTILKGSTFTHSIKYSSIKNEKEQFNSLCGLVISLYSDNNKIPITNYEVDFNLSVPSIIESDLKNVLDFNKPVVAIYPGSSPNAIYRRWGVQKFIDLSEKLLPYANVVIVGGPDEIFISKDFEDVRFINIINKYSLDQNLLLFRNVVDLFVGNDAGLLHLAFSQGCPTVGIFGPNVGSKWGGNRSLDKVIEIDLECRPCIKTHLGVVPNVCRYDTVECIDRISVEKVFIETIDSLNLISKQKTFKLNKVFQNVINK